MKDLVDRKIRVKSDFTLSFDGNGCDVGNNNLFRSQKGFVGIKDSNIMGHMVCCT